jgi:hypothetical protein
MREDLTGANSWGELFRAIVGGALLHVGILCMCLGSFILVIAYGPEPSLDEPPDAPHVRPSPPQTQEDTITVVCDNAEVYGVADERNQIQLLELMGAAAFLLGLGALLSLTSMWIKWIGRTRKLETIVKQIAKSRS